MSELIEVERLAHSVEQKRAIQKLAHEGGTFVGISVYVETKDSVLRVDPCGTVVDIVEL